MCLVAFAINASPCWPFVLASNRDEFLDRPTWPLDRWKTASGQEIISGRDGRAGGTWLGVTPGGRVAFLTNVRERKRNPMWTSRGELVTRWLESSGAAEEFSAQHQSIDNSSTPYGGFNLVLGDLQHNAWTWLTNRPAGSGSGSGWQTRALPAGVYGLSNAALDTPWPKTLELKRVLSAAIVQAEKPRDFHALLWPALAKRAREPLSESSKMRIFQTSDPAFADAFVDSPEQGYGTRSSTLLVVGKHHFPSQDTLRRMEMHERTYLRNCDGVSTMGFQTTSLLI